MLNRIFLIVTCLFCGYSAFICAQNMIRYNAFKLEHQDVQQKQQGLMEIKMGYQESIDALELPAWWELEAKKKMGYSQPGERVYKFYD